MKLLEKLGEYCRNSRLKLETLFDTFFVSEYKRGDFWKSYNKNYDTNRVAKALLENDAFGRGFNKTSIKYSSPVLFSLIDESFSIEYDIKNNGKVVIDKETLGIGFKILKRAYAIHQLQPERFRGITRFVINHEKSHKTGPASLDRIIEKQVERYIRKNNLKPNSRETESIAWKVHYDKRCTTEREAQANLQAIVECLNEPSMTTEKLKEDIAATKLLYPKGNVGSYSYLSTFFPFLKPKCLNEIEHEGDKIGGDYRKLLDKKESHLN